MEVATSDSDGKAGEAGVVVGAVSGTAVSWFGARLCISLFSGAASAKADRAFRSFSTGMSCVTFWAGSVKEGSCGVELQSFSIDRSEL